MDRCERCKTFLNRYNCMIHFAIKLRGENTIIGEAGLFNSFSDLKKMEVGYIIDRMYWNNGYGTEVCQGLIDYAFSQLRCTEFIARMYDQNIGSIRVCEKLGFEHVLTGETENKKVFRYSRKTSV
nr:GNAT family N-acetyltransferase [uncultured Parabacteroides sp.]